MAHVKGSVLEQFREKQADDSSRQFFLRKFYLFSGKLQQIFLRNRMGGISHIQKYLLEMENRNGKHIMRNKTGSE